jgi:predicted amidohydrolase YtcJ
MPAKSWLDAGAQVSAGTDYPIGFYEPTKTIWGMVTRQTARVGVQGPEYVVDRYTAIHLCTLAGAQLHGDAGRLGSLQPGYLADLIAFQRRPDDLRNRRVAGNAAIVHYRRRKDRFRPRWSAAASPNHVKQFFSITRV